jgi:hypothetical protein
VPVVKRCRQHHDQRGQSGRGRKSKHGPRIRTRSPSSHSIEGLDWSYPLKRSVLPADKGSQNEFRGPCRSVPR